jgi:hypothetical protein
MAGVQVSKFDVLAEELPCNVYILDDYRNHIGNSRFAVLVEMYHDAFQQNYRKNNEVECDKIVQRIVDVTCHKDVNVTTNRGRFVVRPATTTNDGIAGASDNGGWRCLDEEGSKELVRQVLRAPSLKDDEDDDDELEPIPISAATAFTSMESIPSIDFGNLELNDDGNKKRGRRQSLLRRSASESTMLLDKKKLYRDLMEDVPLRDLSPLPAGVRRYHSNATTGVQPPPPPAMGLGRSVSVASSIPGSAIPPNLRRKSAYSSGGTVVPTFRGMDVVLASNLKSLSAKPDIVGNNRLKVMLTLEKGRYNGLSPDEQVRVATDLVKTVTEYWEGHVLVENLFVYNILSQDEAVEAFQNLLSVQEGAPFGFIADPGDAAASPSNAGGSSSATTSAPQTNQPLLSAAPPVPEFLRNASREILNGARDETKVGPEQLQLDARKSLQQRQAKRQISKGLGSGRNLAPDG